MNKRNCKTIGLNRDTFSLQNFPILNENGNEQEGI